MIVYIISFFFSLLFMNYALSVKNKYVSLFLHFFAIIPPVFLLTFRAEQCGTDTVHYMDMFHLLDVSSLNNFLAETRLELLFSLLMYGIKTIGLSVEVLFFVCGLLTIVPIYIGSIKLRKYCNPLIPMALFYLMFFQYSFNIVRQSIAMSIIFLAVVYMVENKGKISLLLGIIAMMFHAVAFIFLFVYFSFILIDKSKKYLIILTIISAFVIIFINPSFFTYNYERFQSYEEKGKAGMQMSYLVEMILNFSIVLFFWKKNNTVLRKLFIFVSGLGVFLIILSTRGPFIFRIANCLDIMLLVYIPLAMTSIHQKAFTVTYMSFALFFWWFVFIYNGSGRSYPYILSSSFSLF